MNDNTTITDCGEASPAAVQLMLAAKENDIGGRSAPHWFRLSNGDLMLGIYPRGDTYVECQELDGV